MRLWAEERKGGTIELLLTLPVGLGTVVFAKFLAAWIFTGVALALTFPLWLTISVVAALIVAPILTYAALGRD